MEPLILFVDEDTKDKWEQSQPPSSACTALFCAALNFADKDLALFRRQLLDDWNATKDKEKKKLEKHWTSDNQQKAKTALLVTYHIFQMVYNHPVLGPCPSVAVPVFHILNTTSLGTQNMFRRKFVTCLANKYPFFVSSAAECQLQKERSAWRAAEKRRVKKRKLNCQQVVNVN
jgi:hypothetical protein